MTDGQETNDKLKVDCDIMVCRNVPHYWVLGGYGWVHGAEIIKQKLLLTNAKTQ